MKMIAKNVALLSILLAVFTLNIKGQSIKGIVIDEIQGEALSHVNIGVVDINHGTITNDRGEFVLHCKGLPEDSKICFSMIGYQSITMEMKDLIGVDNRIKLKPQPVMLNEVTVEWKGQTRNIGVQKANAGGGLCGWGGTNFAKGHELGMVLNAGENMVRIEDLNVKIHKQSFDTVTVRLHIRQLLDGKPSQELLTQNIYLSISAPSDWQKLDLSTHNIMVQGEFVLSLEWIDYVNIVNNKAIRVNGKKDDTPKILFNTSKSGVMYSRRGSAARWRRTEESSPAFYVTISE